MTDNSSISKLVPTLVVILTYTKIITTSRTRAVSIRSFFSVSENLLYNKISTRRLTDYFPKKKKKISANKSIHSEVVKSMKRRTVASRNIDKANLRTRARSDPAYAGRSIVYRSRCISHRLRRRLPLLPPSQRGELFYIR